MADYYAPLVFLILVAVSCSALLIAAHRFARRRRREGAWTDQGPVHSTQPPPDWLLPTAWRGYHPTIESAPEDPPSDSASGSGA
jgi:hypothetical protein